MWSLSVLARVEMSSKTSCRSSGPVSAMKLMKESRWNLYFFVAFPFASGVPLFLELGFAMRLSRSGGLNYNGSSLVTN
jgi:hypothetical protein